MRKSAGPHRYERIVTSHADAVVVGCACGWVSAPARRLPAESALVAHIRRSAMPVTSRLAAAS